MAAKPNGAPPNKRRKYDEGGKAEALHPAHESRSPQGTARQSGMSPELPYRWQQA